MQENTEGTATSVAVVKAPRARAPKRHRLEKHPPPPMCACTVEQIEERHPGVKGRLRQWIHRADAGDPAYAWLKFCVIRIERSVLLDEVRFRDSLYQRTAIPAAPSRPPDWKCPRVSRTETRTCGRRCWRSQTRPRADWPGRARVGAVALVALAKAGSPSLGVLLLADLRKVFGDHDAMSTGSILEALQKLDEAPWADLRGKPLDARRLANSVR
jgi:hypothetical protein